MAPQSSIDAGPGATEEWTAGAPALAGMTPRERRNYERMMRNMERGPQLPPAAKARASIRWASVSLVANRTVVGIPASRQRSGSSVHPRGR